jgi:hydroxyethylthiazole kinase
MENAELVSSVVVDLERLRARKPLVHCLTNHVVKGFTANALLALGAAPAMVEHPEEAAQFAGMADALLVNVGTLDSMQMVAIDAAIPAARAAGRPWVLDPVAVGPLEVRTRFARRLLETSPAMVRGNASEVLSLAGEAGAGRGVESGDEARAAARAAERLIARGVGAVLVSGREDLVLGPGGRALVANGHAMMTLVTGVGCAMGAIAAAFCAVSGDSFRAAVATAVVLGIAGERAAETARGPGAFQIALLDALYSIDGATVAERVRFA